MPEISELKIKLYSAYIDRLKKIDQKDNAIKTKMEADELLFNDTTTDEKGEPKGLLQQLYNLIKKREKTREDHLTNKGAEIGTLNSDIVALSKEIKDLEKDTSKNRKRIDEAKEDLKKKKDELAEINKVLDTTLEKLNTEFEEKIKKFKEGTTIKVGGRLIRRTRKHRLQKKPSKRYILSKNKIKKVKSSRYRKKKYTLRKR